MSNLFEKYRSAGNDEAALMVANNEFNKAPGDKAAFEQYFSFVCSLGTSLPSLLDRQAALDKAAVALEYFKEKGLRMIRFPFRCGVDFGEADEPGGLLRGPCP